MIMDGGSEGCRSLVGSFWLWNGVQLLSFV